MRIIAIIFLLIFQSISIAQEVVKPRPYIFFPGSYTKWKSKMSIGVSLTRLPNEIIEEEINTLPMLNVDYKMGLPLKFMLHAKLNSNYISNMGSLAVQKSIFDRKFALALGVNSSYWFGQLYLNNIRLNASGYLFNPYISGGIHIKDLYLSLKIEDQFGSMKTYSDDVFLARSPQPNSAYSFQISIEQALWNNNWVALAVKFNYAKFNYQAWLTYSAFNNYLLYPEYSFTFIF